MGILVVLMKPDGTTPLMTIIWAQKDVVLPSGSATLHAAHSFTYYENYSDALAFSFLFKTRNNL